MKQKIPQENFTNYLHERKIQINNELRVLNETSKFFQKNVHNNFILLDVAKFFNIDLKAARHFIAIWMKYEIVGATTTNRLPKPYKILKLPDDS